jgi:hypothetical protein
VKALLAAASFSLLLLITGATVGFAAPLQGRSRPGYWDRSIVSREVHLPGEGRIYNGDITFYEPSMGSCGVLSSPNEGVVAISAAHFDSYPESAAHGGNPNKNPLCGRMIRPERIDEGGKPCSVDVKIVDRCASCLEGDLDVTEHVFRQLAVPGMGRAKATWSWL